MIDINVTVDLGDFAYEIADRLPEREIVEFILNIDERLDDTSFTKRLIEALKGSE